MRMIRQVRFYDTTEDRAGGGSAPPGRLGDCARWRRAAVCMTALATAVVGLAACSSTPETTVPPGTPSGADATGATGDAGSAASDGGAAQGDAGTAVSDKPFWKVLDLGETNTWNAVTTWSDGGQAGYVLAGTEGTVALFDGEHAEFRNTGQQQDLLAVWAADADHIIVAGRKSTVLHWDRGLHDWLEGSGLPLNSSVDFTCLAGTGIDNVYLGGNDGSLWQYGGPQTGWVDVRFQLAQAVAQADGGSVAAVRALWVSKGNRLFAAVEEAGQDQPGGYLVWGPLGSLNVLHTARVPRAIWGTDGPKGPFVVAVAGQGKMQDPAAWTYSVSADDWTPHTINIAQANLGLTGVWGAAPDNVFATGRKGALIRFHEVSGQLVWTPVSSKFNEPYGLAPPPGSPPEQQFTLANMDFLAIAGRGPEDILLAVTGVTDPDGNPRPSANLLYYHRHLVGLVP